MSSAQLRRESTHFLGQNRDQWVRDVHAMMLQSEGQDLSRLLKTYREHVSDPGQFQAIYTALQHIHQRRTKTGWKTTFETTMKGLRPEVPRERIRSDMESLLDVCGEMVGEPCLTTRRPGPRRRVDRPRVEEEEEEEDEDEPNPPPRSPIITRKPDKDYVPTPESPTMEVREEQRMRKWLRTHFLYQQMRGFLRSCTNLSTCLSGSIGQTSDRQEELRNELTAASNQVGMIRRRGEELLSRFRGQFRSVFIETHDTDAETKEEYRVHVREGRCAPLMAERERIFYFVYSNRARRRVSVDELETFLSTYRKELSSLFRRHARGNEYKKRSHLYTCQSKKPSDRTAYEIVYLTDKRSKMEEEGETPAPRRQIRPIEVDRLSENPFHGLRRDMLFAGKDVDEERIRSLMERGVTSPVHPSVRDEIREWNWIDGFELEVE